MAGGERQEEPISLFYSYSHEDERLRMRLEDQLAALRRSGLIPEWHDRNIEVGKEWAKEIDSNLASADIILLLASASFIASEYCWSVEAKKALERHHKGEAKVIPVILRPCRWCVTPFAKLQAAPKNAKPVTSWRDQNAALDDVANEIQRVVNELRLKRAAAASAAPASVISANSAASVVKPRVDGEKLAAGAAHAGSGTPRAISDFAIFRDVDELWCPEMVVLPAGEFWMGSPHTDEDASKAEKPQHQTRIAYCFAVGRCPVTFKEYDWFVEATGRSKPSDEGWGRNSRPVINVSWEDAQAYVAWLSHEADQPYRLLAEAEWEYAARAGTVTRYWWGDEIIPDDANYEDSGHGKTTPVGSYLQNPWGLHDMLGNVWEWVEDCWHDTYRRAPDDGSAWVTPDCSQRVVRGGSWGYPPVFLRSANRFRRDYNVCNGSISFRIARRIVAKP